MSNPVPHKQGKRKPAQSATQLQAFFNHSPDLLCIIQPDGTFGQLNPAWKRLLDWTPEALQSRPWIELVHPEDVEASLRGRPKTTPHFRCRRLICCLV